MKLKLTLPLRPFILTQSYGEDLACVDTKTYKTVISRTGATCPSGFVSLYVASGMLGHNGLDIAARSWQPIYSSTSGVVTEFVSEKKRGLGLGIVTNDRYEFDRFSAFAKLRYWHLAGMAVEKGDIIKKGQLIGWADNTGYSSGNHLHFELKPVLWDETSKEYYNVLQTNGYYGAIDPTPYLSQMTLNEIGYFIYNVKRKLEDIRIKVGLLFK
ncbi:MAG: M23 family metallopeptidase [Nanoarchaeota archaeon]|nr:M23 family metallopeptidase [Nanoarchaeota archaeon]